MNEELSERLVASLDKVQEYIESTEDFVIEQAPLIAQEIVMLGRLESVWHVLCPLFASIILVVASVLLFKWACRCYEEQYAMGEGPAVASLVISVIGSIAFFAGSISQIHCTFEPWFAPRVYLLHEIAKML